MPQYQIEITDHQSTPIVDHTFLESVIHRVLLEEQVESATISVALVDDAEIHRVNKEFLDHDHPTDVISFRLNESPDAKGVNCGGGAGSQVNLAGELVISTETASREATAHGWSPVAELLLYAVHGLLHLCGYDDLTDEARPKMRTRERELLAIWEICPTDLES